MRWFWSNTFSNISGQVDDIDAFCWVSRIAWQVWSNFTIVSLVKSENKQWDTDTVCVALHGSLVWFHRWPSCNAVTHLAKLPWWLIAIDIDKLVINEPKSAQIQLIPVSPSRRLVSILVWSWVSLSFWFRLEHFIAFQFVIRLCFLSSFMWHCQSLVHVTCFARQEISKHCVCICLCACLASMLQLI